MYIHTPIWLLPRSTLYELRTMHWATKNVMQIAILTINFFSRLKFPEIAYFPALKVLEEPKEFLRSLESFSILLVLSKFRAEK